MRPSSQVQIKFVLITPYKPFDKRAHNIANAHMHTLTHQTQRACTGTGTSTSTHLPKERVCNNKILQRKFHTLL